ncbi:hypothetical protein [Lactobacillus sp.]|uniref:hypothetical protein n=1 Tax=Lactobacillus sp. TaxID=1591 RepID=UPI0025C419E0|nr:hypothetical protein [Lactobacillus sp.]
MMTKLNLYYLKLKGLYKEYEDTIHAGMILWLGIFIVLFGIGFIRQTHAVNMPNKYSAAVVSTEKGMKTIKSDFAKKQPFTLVLYRPDCSACQSVETRLMKDYWYSKQQSKVDHIMLNVNKLDEKNRSELLQLVPQIAVDGDKIPTPLTANVQPTSKTHAVVKDISKDNNPSKFEKVLKNSKNLEEH